MFCSMGEPKTTRGPLLDNFSSNSNPGSTNPLISSSFFKTKRVIYLSRCFYSRNSRHGWLAQNSQVKQMYLEAGLIPSIQRLQAEAPSTFLRGRCLATLANLASNFPEERRPIFLRSVGRTRTHPKKTTTGGRWSCFVWGMGLNENRLDVSIAAGVLAKIVAGKLPKGFCPPNGPSQASKRHAVFLLRPLGAQSMRETTRVQAAEQMRALGVVEAVVDRLCTDEDEQILCRCLQLLWAFLRSSRRFGLALPTRGKRERERERQPKFRRRSSFRPIVKTSPSSRPCQCPLDCFCVKQHISQ